LNNKPRYQSRGVLVCRPVDDRC